MRTRTRALIAVAIGLHLIFLFAGFISPSDPAAQNRRQPYAPPNHLHFRGADGWHVRPFVYRMVPGADGYEEDRSQPFPVHFLVHGPRITWLA